MESEEKTQLIKAGKLAKQVVEYAKTIVKAGMPLIEIADLIDQKISDLGAKPAFPVNLSINEQAAHCTPSNNSRDLAHGLLKIDIGIHLDGYVADTAFSLDLDNLEKNKQLINAAQESLKAAIEAISINIPINQIGKAIEDTAKSLDTLPINNLSGHKIEQYNLHAGINMPNYDNSQTTQIPEGLYAIEPFTTHSSGSGSVKEGKPSSIYKLENANANARLPIARKILQYIKENYNTLPFCSRWLVKEFGLSAQLALNQLEQQNILHQYPQLLERSGQNVAQAEHSILILDGEKIVTTE